MLTAATIKTLNEPGRYADRDGLYLQVTKKGSRSWIYRYQINGKRREMGLGALKEVSLKDARELAGDARKLQRRGIDPKAQRDRQQATQGDPGAWTFDKCATAYIKAHAPGWKNEKHEDQWRNTLETYVKPVFGHLPVDQVDTSLVMQVLQPIWNTKTETASRLRGRIERIISWAIVQGYRSGPNPALWRGHLSMLLPQRAKVQKVTHHAALPYSEIGEFMPIIRGQKGLSARAIEFTIMTAARTGEVIGAEWIEVDLVSRIWTIPGERTKSGRDHRVPLSDQAVALLEALEERRWSDFIFPSRQHGKHLSNMAMLTLLKRLGRNDITVHGFRSTFRDWAAECTNYPRELAESALAHILSDKTEAAYQRGDLLEKRRIMMQEWADFIDLRPATK